MKGKRLSDEQIIRVLKETAAGAKVADVCRKHGISAFTYYRWKSKYGGMELNDLKRISPWTTKC